MRPDHRGFSLIELLIVVAIILIIAAIAIPNFMRSRMAANQASAIQSMRVISTAQVTYASTYGGGYSAALSELGPPPAGVPPSSSAAGLIDETMATGVKSGYSFLYSPTLQDTTGRYNGYNVQANPTTPGQSGTTYYFTDQSHVIRANPTGPAGASDTPVAQ